VAWFSAGWDGFQGERRRIGRPLTRRESMQIDWITWGIWAFGLAILLYWCFETFREFKSLFSKHKANGQEPHS
jgi:hypothetical protein